MSVWSIDVAHSSIEFKVRHMMLSKVRGAFKAWSSDLSFNADDPTKSRVRVEVDVSSIDTGNEGRDTHLKSGDFFDVESWPKITFESVGVRRDKEDLVIEGDLSIRGVTKRISVAFETLGRGVDPWGNTRIGFSGVVKVDRRDFGLTWNQALEMGGVLVGDVVEINAEIQVIEGQG